jgi:DNA recombination-dependent growth factor C
MNIGVDDLNRAVDSINKMREQIAEERDKYYHRARAEAQVEVLTKTMTMIIRELAEQIKGNN